VARRLLGRIPDPLLEYMLEGTRSREMLQSSSSSLQQAKFQHIDVCSVRIQSLRVEALEGFPLIVATTSAVLWVYRCKQEELLHEESLELPEYPLTRVPIRRSRCTHRLENNSVAS
jgi:hypothetical protein